jgi:RNA polymerase sigma factor (sigma-70 family)
LQAAGTLGLCEAARRFKPRKGAAFSTYAWNWVKGHVLSELRRAHVVPVPEHLARAASKRGEPVRGVVVFLHDHASLSLEHSRARAGNAAEGLGGADGQEGSADRCMRLRALREAVPGLCDPVHRFVVRQVFLGRTVEQIADCLETTDARVEELLDEAREELSWMLDGA